MPEAGQYRCLIKIKDSKAMLSFAHMMSHPQSTAYEETPKIFGAASARKRVLIPADPLADARAWLAAMEISHRRTARQTAKHSGNVNRLRSAPPNDDLRGNQFLGDSGQMRTR